MAHMGFWWYLTTQIATKKRPGSKTKWVDCIRDIKLFCRCSVPHNEPSQHRIPSYCHCGDTWRHKHGVEVGEIHVAKKSGDVQGCSEEIESDRFDEAVGKHTYSNPAAGIPYCSWESDDHGVPDRDSPLQGMRNKKGVPTVPNHTRRENCKKEHIEHRIHVKIRLANAVGDTTKNSNLVSVVIFKENVIMKAQKLV